MIQFFRKLMYSKFGVGVTLAFLVVLGLAFAAGDVTGFGGLSGIGSGDRVATVGGQKISGVELSQAITSQVDQAREKNPTATAKSFVASGAVEPLLADMIDRLAVLVWGQKHGLGPSDRLVDSEIAKIPAFRGADGAFDEKLYKATIQQRGFNDAQVRRDIAESLAQRVMLAPAEIAALMPPAAVTRYAGVITERRRGAIALLPSAAFAPAGAPTDAEIAAYYNAHKGDYARPERRTIRFATFTDAALKSVPAPTEAEIATAYNNAKERFAASETHNITQLILPTEAAARAVLAEVAAGKSLEAAAAGKGLSVARIAVTSKDQLAGQTSAAVADATFAAPTRKVVGPARSPLGWHLMRVDTVVGKPGKTLDQARPEIVEALGTIKRRAALTDFAQRIEDEFDKGASLAEVAKELGLTVTATAPLTADGQIYGAPGQTAPAQLAKVIPAAFAMEAEGQPQLAEVETGKTFVLFDAGAIVRAAPAPLGDVRAQVATDLALSRGAVAAHAAAQRIEAAIKRGQDVGAAVAGLGVALPPIDRVDTGREQLQAMREVAPPLQVLFAMAQGKVRVVGAPRNRGWYVIKLDQIVPGTVAANDPRMAALSQQLGQLAAHEYADQLAAAMRLEVGVKRNQAGVRAVTTRLLGN